MVQWDGLKAIMHELSGDGPSRHSKHALLMPVSIMLSENASKYEA